MPTSFIAPPADEPVSLPEAKAHLRVDGNEEDALIASLLSSAREYAEAVTGRQLVTATLRLSLDAFPRGRELELPCPPLQSVTAVRYYDATGEMQTLAESAYHVDRERLVGRIVLASGASWPSTDCRPNVVQIEYVAGYGDPEDVPARIKQAILLDVGDGYAQRETLIVGTVTSELKRTVDALLWPYRVFA